MKKEDEMEVRREVEGVWKEIKKNDEVREVGVKLISKLKSELEGRGVVPEDELKRRRRSFWAMIRSLEEDDTD